MALNKLIRNKFSTRKPVVVDTGPGLTKQNHKDECNVNLILARYQKTGVIEHRQEFEAQYDDATGVDFQEAMNLVISAENMFKELPSTVRKEFENDPGKFMTFVNNPENMEKMIEMGLAVEQVPEPPVQVEVINKTSNETPSEAPQA